MSTHFLSCLLIGASFACPDRCGDRAVWSGRGGPPNRSENPPNRSEKDDRRGGDLHRSASFRPPKPERANRDKFRKLSGMACSRFPNPTFSWDFPDLAFQLGLLWWKSFEGRGWSGRSDRADPARFRKGGVGSRSAWSWSDQFRSGLPDRPIGVRSVRSGTTKHIFACLVRLTGQNFPPNFVLGYYGHKLHKRLCLRYWESARTLWTRETQSSSKVTKHDFQDLPQNDSKLSSKAFQPMPLWYCSILLSLSLSFLSGKDCLCCPFQCSTGGHSLLKVLWSCVTPLLHSEAPSPPQKKGSGKLVPRENCLAGA